MRHAIIHSAGCVKNDHLHNEAFLGDSRAGTQASQKRLEWKEGQVALALIVIRGTIRLEWAFEPLPVPREEVHGPSYKFA